MARTLSLGTAAVLAAVAVAMSSACGIAAGWWAGQHYATSLLLLSSAFVAIRIAIPHLIAAGRTLARLLIASLVLAAAAPLLKVRRPERADLPPLVGCGLCGMAGYQLLLNAGERTVPAGTANLLVNTSPVIAALLAWRLLRERPTRSVRAGTGRHRTGSRWVPA
jgi:drug/metabolite transporter (DMT)-like permease